jgi:hypothetical protein
MRWLADQDRRASFRRDGYLSLAAWLSDRHRVAAGAAKNQVKVAAALEAMPEVRQAFSAGEVSSSAVRVLADAREEHPEAFAMQEAALVDSAMTKGVGELRRVMADWCQSVDQQQAVAVGRAAFRPPAPRHLPHRHRDGSGGGRARS